MARTWNSYKDAEAAVETVVQIMDQTGTLPPELVEAYKQSMAKTRPGMIQYFYTGLAARCPEALKYFSGEGARNEKNPNPY